MPQPRPILLMTRPRAQAERFVARLRGTGAVFDVIHSPLFGIRFLGPVPDAAGLRGLIFTSENGVAAWAHHGGRTDLPAYAVGAATAERARKAGMATRSADGNAGDLIDLIARERPEAPLLHVRGVHSRGSIAERLTRLSIPTREAILYDQPELELLPDARAALNGHIPVVAPLFSPRSAALFARERVKAPLLVAGMSEAVVNAAAPLHIWKLRIAERPESDAMLRAVADLLVDAGESLES